MFAYLASSTATALRRAAVLATAAALIGPAIAEEPRSERQQGAERRRIERAAKPVEEPPMKAGAGGLAARSGQEAGGPKRGVMERAAGGQWVEGPGFEVTYGSNYDGCAQRCLANAKCVMIEYYRPEKKCNLYNAMRPLRKGGSSDVAFRN